MKCKRLVKVLAALGVLALPILGLNQTYAKSSFTQVTVTADKLNVRAAADNSSRIIGHVYQGDTFEVIQTKNHWDEIKLANNQFGWVNNTYLAPVENLGASVTAMVLRVREHPNLSGKIIGKLNWGTKVTIKAEQDGWAQVTSSTGEQGWVYEDYIAKDPSGKQTVGAGKNGSASAKTTTAKNKSDSSKTKTSGTIDSGSDKITTSGKNGSFSDNTASSVKNDSGSDNTASSGEDDSVPDKTTSSGKNDSTSSQTTNAAFTMPVPNADQPVLSTNSQKDQNSLKGKTIVLDPGHGGKDDGATSVTGTPEKSLTLATAKAVEQKLENAGAHVVMTRTNDTYIPLNQRANLSNQNRADAFISFHYNWTDSSSISGLTDYYYQAGKGSSLASSLIKEVAKTTGLKNDGTSFDNLEVLRENSQPSTLLELGFISDKQDDSVIETSDYPDCVAEGVYWGLVDYFSVAK